MANLITEQSSVVCSHQGKVVLKGSQNKLKIDGARVLLMADMTGAAIVGCTQTNAAAGQKPCLTVVSVLSGMATKCSVDGQPVLLESAQGVTDGVPPGSWSAQSAGQTKLQSE